MKRRSLSLTYSILLGVFFALSVVSCGKKDPAKAQITVVDANNDRVADATVYMICTAVEKSNCVLGDTGTTNSAGQVDFEFDHPAIYGSDDVGFAVLKVEAWKDYDTTFCQTYVDQFGNDTTICRDTVLYQYGDLFIELQVDKVAKEEVTVLRDY